MPTEPHGEYPPDWPEISTAVKEEAGWCCIRCDHPHDPAAGYCLTVHHLDGNKANCEWWNLTALCQRCHLTIQAKVVMNRIWMFQHSKWFRPYVAGYYAHHLELKLTREQVIERADDIIAFVVRHGADRANPIHLCLNA